MINKEKLSISEAFMLAGRLSQDLAIATNQIEDLEKEIDQLKSIIKDKEKIIQRKNDEITMLNAIDKEGVFNN